ncbi:uncharacterized protein LOC115634314 isoform X2 [Scaptodrosophila lebanonensis]|uniref:Uncharacterized protein LOC115634314 isoform X2 n=1 Tax=Drosophila lebanonensis TaxID=7225 RepID=A0A6J2UK20_DROLE|nr:uncharacterized protein LOC115634314 isoform X2 [Scaptodrosophila lebanonensis]
MGSNPILNAIRRSAMARMNRRKLVPIMEPISQKRGRGRPRKNPHVEKTKRDIGRPRKNIGTINQANIAPDVNVKCLSTKSVSPGRYHEYSECLDHKSAVDKNDFSPATSKVSLERVPKSLNCNSISSPPKIKRSHMGKIISAFQYQGDPDSNVIEPLTEKWNQDRLPQNLEFSNERNLNSSCSSPKIKRGRDQPHKNIQTDKQNASDRDFKKPLTQNLIRVRSPNNLEISNNTNLSPSIPVVEQWIQGINRGVSDVDSGPPLSPKINSFKSPQRFGETKSKGCSSLKATSPVTQNVTEIRPAPSIDETVYGKKGFVRGLKPSHIIGGLMRNDKLHLMIQFENDNHLEILPAEVLKMHAPRMLLDYYSSHYRLN